MGAGVRDAFPPPMCKCITEIGRGGACVPARVAPQGCIHRSSPRTMRVFLVWKHRYSDVRAGTQAPPLRFRLGGLRVGRLISFGVNCAWTEFCLCRIAWENITERGRGGAYVPAHVALQGRIHRSIPRAQCVMHKTHFPYGNAAARTFGRARRHRPYSFVWADCAWAFDVVWVDCAWMVGSVWGRLCADV